MGVDEFVTYVPRRMQVGIDEAGLATDFHHRETGELVLPFPAGLEYSDCERSRSGCSKIPQTLELYRCAESLEADAPKVDGVCESTRQGN